MPKKSLFTITLPLQSKSVVKKGDHVSHGMHLATLVHSELAEFNLADILGIKPHDVYAHLQVKVGDMVKADQVIAQKGGLLHLQVVKAPLSGKFTLVDRATGLVGIEHSEEKQDLKSVFNATVMDVDDTQIVLEVNGTVLTGKTGQGQPVTGKLVAIETDIYPADLDGCVAVFHRATDRDVAKADALGAVAILAQTIEEPPFKLPYILFSDLHVLKDVLHKTAVVYGDQKELLILE